MFQGVNPSRSHPKGKITLSVTFGGELNYRTEKVVFDVVDLPLPYNGIPGCPALAKFMAASHYAYNTLKMPGPLGSLPPIRREGCYHLCGQDIPGHSHGRGNGSSSSRQGSKGKKRDCRDSGKESGKRAPTERMAPVDNVPECSNSKKSKVTAPQFKKVSAGPAGVDGTFTISATLDDK